MLPEIRADTSFWLMLALLFLILPVSWVISALLAAAIHEICHLAVLWVRRSPVHELKLTFGGARIKTSPMLPQEELMAALAGPAGSFLLVTGIHLFPRLGICALIQGCINLLPLGDLDGARILRSGFELLPGKRPCKQKKIGVQ